MKKKPVHAKKKTYNASESVIIQIGVAVIVVGGFAILTYSMIRFFVH